MTDLLERTPATLGDLGEAFRGDGYAILHGALPLEEVEACAAVLGSLRDIHPDVNVPASAPAAERFEGMARLVHYGNDKEAVAAIALNATIRKALWQMFGQEPVARFTRLLAQSPGAIPANAERRGTPHLHNFGMATRPAGGRAIVWTPVDDVHPDAGPMWFLPKSHLDLADFPDRLIAAVPGSRDALLRMWRDGASAEDWLRWHGDLGDHSMAMLADWMDATNAKAVPVLLRRGDVLIFSNDLLHGTLPAKNPTLSRRIMFTHYHADHHELWEIGDALGSLENPDGPRLYGHQDWVRTDRGLTDPEAFRRFYASMPGFFG
jgi:hypothetical protein